MFVASILSSLILVQVKKPIDSWPPNPSSRELSKFCWYLDSLNGDATITRDGQPYLVHKFTPETRIKQGQRPIRLSILLGDGIMLHTNTSAFRIMPNSRGKFVPNANGKPNREPMSSVFRKPGAFADKSMVTESIENIQRLGGVIAMNSKPLSNFREARIMLPLGEDSSYGEDVVPSGNVPIAFYSPKLDKRVTVKQYYKLSSGTMSIGMPTRFIRVTTLKTDFDAVWSRLNKHFKNDYGPMESIPITVEVDGLAANVSLACPKLSKQIEANLSKVDRLIRKPFSLERDYAIYGLVDTLRSSRSCLIGLLVKYCDSKVDKSIEIILETVCHEYGLDYQMLRKGRT